MNRANGSSRTKVTSTSPTFASYDSARSRRGY